MYSRYDRVAKISVEESGVEDIDGSIEVVVDVQSFVDELRDERGFRIVVLVAGKDEPWLPGDCDTERIHRYTVLEQEPNLERCSGMQRTDGH